MSSILVETTYRTGEPMSLVSFLYRYVFRGIGFVLFIGGLTILYLAIRSQMTEPQAHHQPTTAHKMTTERRQE
jgi:hypothetical protein